MHLSGGGSLLGINFDVNFYVKVSKKTVPGFWLVVMCGAS